MDNPTISNIFGMFGAVAWSVQLCPQIILNARRHSAAGLSPGFMACWTLAGIPLGIYNVVSDFSIALQIQPQILTSLSLITLGQCHYYEKKWSVQKVLACAVPAACMMGGVEAALVVALRIGEKNGMRWPLILMAVLAALLLALGVMEQYIAIWKNRSVEGISFLFCGIDALGDITSIISLIFEPTLNKLGMVMYGVEFALWVGIFALGFYFKFWPWIGRRLKERNSAQASHRDVPDTAVSLHDMPSSTSVFRTVSGEENLRSRISRSSGQDS